jgi:23S rRNA pseudouridine1911/1915/1917 synthase
VTERGLPNRPAGRVERLTAPADAPRLDVLIAAKLDISRNQAATLIANGNVRVAGRLEKASYRAEAGEEVVVEVPPPRGREVAGEDIPLRVAFEDDDVIVIDKPAGMVVHPAPGNWTGTLVNALKGRGGKLADTGDPSREGIVHRLDKETSGLLLVAKTDRAHTSLGAAMTARRIARRYAVLSWGHITGDKLTVDKPLGRDPRDRTRMAVLEKGRTAKTDFVRLARFDPGDLLRARLHTGRTHQIRVHLASVGHPVVGDDTYGGGGGRKLVGLAPKRHFLHAAWLVFPHPATGEPVDVRSPLPDDLRSALVRIAEGSISADVTDPLTALGFFAEPS